jgi:hypothetical protein
MLWGDREHQKHHQTREDKESDLADQKTCEV